jgi:zinc protease
LCFALTALAAEARTTDYVVMASRTVMADAEWKAVAEKLTAKHDATLVEFDIHPNGAMAELQRLRPRYVAVVETPERLNREYIMVMNRMSRRVDDDIYADYIWGVVSGYDAAGAMRMVDNSTEPLVVKNAVATIMETNSAKWFDRYGYVDDHTPGLWGEKRGRGEAVVRDSIDPKLVLPKFTELYAAYDPDLVITAAHATERNLEMPFSLGNWRARDGRLYADDRFTGEKWDVPQNGRRKVYFAVGNCLIGNFDGTRESMAPAWINSADAATMVGYVVTTWHGRNGWGGLKYWLTNAGRMTLAEAVYLNQQDMLHQLDDWSPELVTTEFTYDDNFETQLATAAQEVGRMTGDKPMADQIGFWHDRDVLAYYGDPKWEVDLQGVADSHHFKSVSVRTHGQRATVTVKTNRDFDIVKMKGDGFKMEHVLDLPFAFRFPHRLGGTPRLAAGQPWDAVVTEDFLLIYDPAFEPGKTYKIEIEL